MGRCSIQVVMGPAGSGKSTYCSAMQEHCAAKVAGGAPAGTTLVSVANLDPAAEHFDYEPAFDVRDLINVTEAMEELELGPNGALLYCMEYLLENLDWLHDQLEEFGDDEYVLLDCPGQLELYTHVPVQKRILDAIAGWGYAGSMVSVFCIDAAFCIDASKFLSGSLLSLSAMVALELPHVSVLTKCDLMPESEVDRIMVAPRAFGISIKIDNLCLPLTKLSIETIGTSHTATKQSTTMLLANICLECACWKPGVYSGIALRTQLRNCWTIGKWSRTCRSICEMKIALSTSLPLSITAFNSAKTPRSAGPISMKTPSRTKTTKINEQSSLTSRPLCLRRTVIVSAHPINYGLASPRSTCRGSLPGPTA
jgi:GPN-loop GTPase